MRYAQSVLDHPVEQLWDVMVLDHERRAEPLRVVLGMLANPFIRSLSERPNERKRSLRQDPNVGFVGRALHCLPSVFPSGGAGLIGKSGRKTARECDMHAQETTRNIVRDFTAFWFHYPSPAIIDRSSQGYCERDQVNPGRQCLTRNNLRISGAFRPIHHCALIDRARPRPHSAHFDGN